MSLSVFLMSICDLNSTYRAHTFDLIDDCDSKKQWPSMILEKQSGENQLNIND